MSISLIEQLNWSQLIMSISNFGFSTKKILCCCFFSKLSRRISVSINPKITQKIPEIQI